MMSEPQRRGRKAEFRPYRLGPAVPRHERPWDGAARNGWELVLSGELTDKEGELHQPSRACSCMPSVSPELCGDHSSTGKAGGSLLHGFRFLI